MPNHTIAGLARTSHFKLTTYRGDGSGRDYYVTSNDGGMFKPGTIQNYQGMAEKSDYMSKTNYFHNVAHRTANAPPKVQYFGDGTGRDSYVVFTPQ